MGIDIITNYELRITRYASQIVVMRIIAGSKARFNLLGPRDLSTRPITDRVKESLFSILTPVLSHAIVADIFCGTGSLGLEAVSRGAMHAIMVDRDRDAIRRLRTNIEKLGFQNETTVRQADAFKCGIPMAELPGSRRCDIVFVDPPFLLSRDTAADSQLGRLLIKLNSQIADDALVVVRHERKVEMSNEYGQLQQDDRRNYGSMAITFFKWIVNSG